MKPTYQSDCGRVVLYNADCLDVLPTLGKVDAVITDPPYGIGFVSTYRNSIDYGGIRGDDQPFDPAPLLRHKQTILWGGNNYADKLPIGGWIVWDKRLSAQADKILGSPFELAWCSRPTTFRMIRAQHCGAKNADAPNGEVANQPRFHPTQKPIVVMEACLQVFSKAQTILDPFMGSGSTGIACLRQGRSFIGVEIEAKYYEIAKRRILAELAQKKMF